MEGACKREHEQSGSLSPAACTLQAGRGGREESKMSRRRAPERARVDRTRVRVEGLDVRAQGLGMRGASRWSGNLAGEAGDVKLLAVCGD